jgi:hypothetical protein
MHSYISYSIILLALLAGAPTEDKSNAAQLEAIEKIKNLGGTIKYDDKQEGKPVISISLPSTKVNDADLAFLQYFPKLEELDLFGTTISDKATGYFGELKSLRKLNITNTNVTDAGLEKLKDLPNLKELFVSFVPDITKITKTGINKLKSANPKLQINYLSVGSDGRPIPRKM